MESETSNEAPETLDGGDLASTRGQLSSRMQKEGLYFNCMTLAYNFPVFSLHGCFY